MIYLYALIAWVIGLIAGSFGVIQLLIILCFSIPTTLKFKKEAAFKDNTPLISDFISLCVITLILFVVSFVFVRFFPDYQIAYWIGVCMTTLLGLGQIGGNANNESDYMSSHAKYLTPEYISTTNKGEEYRIAYLFNLYKGLLDHSVSEQEALMYVWGEIKIKHDTCLLKNEYGYEEKPIEAKKVLINQLFGPLDAASYDIYRLIEFVIAWEFHEKYNNKPTIEDIRAGKNDTSIIEKKVKEIGKEVLK